MNIQNQLRTCAYEITPVTTQNAQAFYDLIQEQASAHGAALPACEREEKIQRLLSDITENGLCEAFLVEDRAAGGPVTAVTFFSAWAPSGRALYLEDIVTTAKQQRKGHGTFALAALAQIAQERGLSTIRWECAAHNERAHAFYDGLGSDRLEGHQTWRRRDGASFNPRLAQGLRLHDCVQEGISGIGTACIAGEEGVTGYFYRSYSTFKAVAGLHVERLVSPRGAQQQTTQLLAGLGASFGRFWPGNFDVTVAECQREWVEPALHSLGFECLSYDGDTMVARTLGGDSLKALARAPGRCLTWTLGASGGTGSRAPVLPERRPILDQTLRGVTP